MLEDDPDLIAEALAFEPEPIHLHMFDLLMRDGWRMLGPGFIRHNRCIWENMPANTLPLRIRLDDFEMTKSQRKTIRRNKDLRLHIGKIQLTNDKHTLFHRHATRFKYNVPPSLAHFLPQNPGAIPVPGLEFAVFDGPKLAAASYIHIGDLAVCGTYGMFDPAFSGRSLGTFTMLAEILYARQMKKKFYYLGYANVEKTGMDYKKRFNNLEAMNWGDGTWRAFPKV